MWSRPVFLVLVAANCVISQSVSVLNLTSSDDVIWKVQNKNGSITVPATVPGGIYSDLMRNGVIGDILQGFNDISTRWVAYDEWIYTAQFKVTKEQLSASVANLVFHGLDTVAYIEINDHAVGKTDNMFIRYVFNVKDKVQAGQNVIRISFTSPIAAANIRSQKYFVEPNCVPGNYYGECHANQIRKMQASFSWDWGPAFPSVGLWKPVSIEFFDSAIIRSVTTHMTKESDRWKVALKVYLETSRIVSLVIEGYLDVQLQVDSKDNKTFSSEIRVGSDQGNAVADVAFEINEDEVSLWWPNGFGDQPLYNLHVTFTSLEHPDEKSYKEVNIGFRIIELVEEDASLRLGNGTAGDGLTFYFKVNGYPLFMKGSNWIPGNILPEFGADENMIDNLLGAAQATHMAMLRVWGGGVYESDYFYSRCDQLGILVWQDFMFACSMYPADDEFLRSVETEVEQNVIRLQHHPSIAIWAGNNENEVALRGNWYNTKEEFDRYKVEYIKLYVDTMRPIVEYIDPGRRYLISSPSNGRESEKEGHIAENPYSEYYGDTHYYNYVSDGWSMNIYPQTRFASEYGFQSLPSLATMKTATDKSEDCNLESDYAQHRQHSPGGNQVIEKLVQLHLHLNKCDEEYFKKFVFYSQISQAMTIKAETEFYRQQQGVWYTMGALYWQLNDVWQAPSWSSIEFGGRWKVLHFFAKSFFAPVLISPRHLPSGDIEVYIINDRFVPLTNVQVVVDTLLWDHLSPIATKTYSVPSVGALASEKQPIVISASEIHDNNIVFYKFSLKSGNDLLSPLNYVFPVSLKTITGSREPNIEIKVFKANDTVHEKGKPRTLIVQITTDIPILFLWLEAEGIDGQFIDNGLVVTDRVTTIDFVTTEKVKTKVLEAAITYQYYTTTT